MHGQLGLLRRLFLLFVHVRVAMGGPWALSLFLSLSMHVRCVAQSVFELAALWGVILFELSGLFDVCTPFLRVVIQQLVRRENVHDAQPRGFMYSMLVPCFLSLLLYQAVASKVLELKEDEQTFTFEGVASEPIPSLLR